MENNGTQEEKEVLKYIGVEEYLIPINSVHDFIEAIESLSNGERGYSFSKDDARNEVVSKITIPPLGVEETLFFRGEASLFSSSLPSVFRNKVLFDNEKKITIEAISGGARELRNENTNFNIISKIQHHKGITRMLDVTTNALTSLFFACSTTNDDGVMGSVQVFVGSNGKNVKRALDKYLYPMIFSEKSKNTIMKLGNRSELIKNSDFSWLEEKLNKKDSQPNIKSFSSDTAELLSTIPLLTLKEQVELAKYSFQDILMKKKYLQNNGRRAVRQLLGEVKRKTPAFEDRIEPLDLFRPIFVIPSQNDERIVRQDGAFLILGLGFDDNFLHLLEQKTKVPTYSTGSYFKTQKYYTEQILRNLRLTGVDKSNSTPTLFETKKPVRFYIPNKETKKKIQKQLAALGINAGKVYADLDHLSEYLRIKYSE